MERLGVGIRLGLLPPGSRLPSERELATRFKISRGTVRQALTALIQGGLLTTRRGRGGGTWVATEPPELSPPTGRAPGDWHEIMDSRLAVEAGVVLLAAQRATGPQLQRLAEINEELLATAEREAPYREFRRLDVQFHLGLAEASASSTLMRRMTEVQDAMTALYGSGYRPKVVLRSSAEQHDAMIRALRRHDGRAAAGLAFEHVYASRLILEGMGGQD